MLYITITFILLCFLSFYYIPFWNSTTQENQRITKMTSLKDPELMNLANTYHRLTKENPSPAFEAYGSERHQVMDALLTKLKTTKAPVKTVLEVFGHPQFILHSFDQIKQLQAGQAPSTAANAFMMPGPFISENINPTSSKVWMIYPWRGNRDFIYFETDDQGENVVNGNWQNAFE